MARPPSPAQRSRQGIRTRVCDIHDADEGDMHPLSDKNPYVGFLFMKMSQEYFSLGREGIHKVTMEHVGDLTKHSEKLTHIVCTGLDARYDQITMVQAESLEEIHQAAVDFRMGAKARYIDLADIVVGIKAPPRGEARRTGH
jgi:hypothetical protein